MHARSAARPVALLSAFLLFTGVALAACGGDDSAKSSDEPTVNTDAKDEGTEAEVTIQAKDFSLTSVTAKPGEEVYVSNTGAKPHTVTADDGSFDSGRTEPGKETEFDAPDEAGTYTFHCSIHASMTGTLTVAA